jgi:hypothetical protein
MLVSPGRQLRRLRETELQVNTPSDSNVNVTQVPTISMVVTPLKVVPSVKTRLDERVAIEEAKLDTTEVVDVKLLVK